MDAISQNGSFCICLLGEEFEDLSVLSSSPEDLGSEYFQEKLKDAIKMAIDSGYHWIRDESESKVMTMLELLSMQAGLMSKVKFPLFYFRVSGGPVSDRDGPIDPWLEDTEKVNPRMERLKQKLIRNGLPIRFYGSAAEFDEVVERDLVNIIGNYPERTTEQDDFMVDQQCFEKEKRRYFTRNETINVIVSELDCFYSALQHWTKPKSETEDSERIDVAIKDFYRKDFSDKLQNVYKKMNLAKNKAETTSSSSCEGIRILILNGSRCSGKSTILSNWLSYKEDKSIHFIVHYCNASFVASDLRVMLKRLINSIRSTCHFEADQDSIGSDRSATHSLDCELKQLSQELHGAMLLCVKAGVRIIIVIDGLDHLGDHYVQSSQKIKDIHWIPEFIPDNIRLILTCATSDYSFIQLQSSRDDVKVLQTMSENNIDEDMISAGLRGLTFHIEEYSQICSENILRNIREWPLISNPMVQKIVAHVHHTLGGTENWEKFLDNISECHSVVELVRRVLKLWVTFLNWEVINVNEKSLKKKYTQRKEEKIEEDSFVKGWIPDCLSLIVLTRNGLLLDAIPSMLKKLGYSKEFRVEESDVWRLFHLAQGIMLRYHNAKIDFSHALCRDIVGHTFLAIANCGSVEARTQESNDSMFTDRRCKFHILLANIFWTRQSEQEGNIEECLYHLDKASDYATLARIIYHPKIVMRLFDIESQDLDLWQGQMKSIHKFLYYWKLLSKEGHDLVAIMREYLFKQYKIPLDDSLGLVDAEEHNSTHNAISRQHKRTLVQSEFAKKLKINYSETDEKEIFSSFSENQSLRYLFLLGKIAALMGQTELARMVFARVINCTKDHVLVCHAMWADIALGNVVTDKVDGNDYVRSALTALEDLSSKVLDDETEIQRAGSVIYLRCMALVQQCSLQSPGTYKPIRRTYVSELKAQAPSLHSIVLNSQLLELESDSIEISNNYVDMNKKLSMLMSAIVTLETWTGPLNLRLAGLWVKLGVCFKHGNYQARLKAEACCRRAMSIWSSVRCENDASCTVAENSCRELLISLLLEDISQSSVAEAKTHLFATYDSRVTSLGCDHPNTRRLAPFIKLVSTLELETRDQINGNTRKSQRRLISPSGIFTNTSNRRSGETKQTKRKDEDYDSMTTSASGFGRGNRPKTACSLQFINRFTDSSEVFQEDIDWDALAERNGGFQSRSCNVSALGRRTISRSTRTDLLSCDLGNLSFAASSASIGDTNISRHIYSGHKSSLSYNEHRHRARNHSGADSRQQKEVRFSSTGFFSGSGRDQRQLISETMQAKLSQMEIRKGHNWLPTKKSFSAVFCRPYYSISDPMTQ